MSVEWEEEVPPERPDAGDGEPEVHDQPMGVPADSEPDEAPLPGVPEKEPPSSG